MNQNHPPEPPLAVELQSPRRNYGPDGPLPDHPPEAAHAPHVQADIDRREQLRAEELEHLTELRDRIQRGINRGEVSLESGTQMLLNISKARMALSGVGMYPGAW